nr:hypothetical protein [uncultured Draconibacterium sp.]
MRRANDIERIYQLSSRRGNEERSVATEPQMNCHLEGGTTERSVTTEQHGEEAVKNFTPRFGLTPYNGACSLNCPPTGRGTSGAGGFGEGPAEVGGYIYAFISLASTLPRESFAWSTTQNKAESHAIVPKFRERGSDFLSNLNASRSARHLKVGLKADQQSLGVSQTLKVSKQDYTSSATVRFHRAGNEFADGRVSDTGGMKKFADCRFRLPMGANNLPIDAFKLPIDGLNCRLTRLNCQLTAQIARGRVNATWGAVNMRVSEIAYSGVYHLTAVNAVPSSSKEEKRSCCETSALFQYVEMEYEHFSSSQEEYVRQLADGRWCLNTIGIPPHRCKRGTPLLEEGKLDLAAKLLTTKDNNPPLKRIAGTTKNARLSVQKTMGTGDNNLFPFFLISNLATARICRVDERINKPYDAIVRQQQKTVGAGAVVISIKTIAYET